MKGFRVPNKNANSTMAAPTETFGLTLDLCYFVHQGCQPETFQPRQKTIEVASVPVNRIQSVLNVEPHVYPFRILESILPTNGVRTSTEI